MSSLPPVEQLRFFDAAARHLSFQQAANELCVSPAAVSQRVRALEAQLNTALFVRHTRRVSLTPAGEMLATKTRQAFGLLNEGVTDIKQLHGRSVFTISTTTTFAEQFLMGHIDRFQHIFPDRDNRVLVSNNLVDFRQDQVDVAVRQGLGAYPGCTALPLGSDRYMAVASPELAANFAAEKAVTGIRVDWPARITDFPRWNDWYALQGMPSETASRQLNLPTEALAVRAAVNGQGIALIHTLHIREELASGALVPLLGQAQQLLASPYRYHLVWPENVANPVTEAFCQWLAGQLS
ncbi:LysR family transcriptional regulator [Aliamphritea hakodatensis]|uniref:LysR family transcriptional regulator n=1 Tax=Aliamphritea hakodatensis TaxID=2895352 RepID=UPI0022FD9738|nr:LysR family transcriptional regulator [Aliamphritea hakodatensis]